LNVALKEWASVGAALEAGLQICLLRKGGIIEADRGGFQLRYSSFLLFPTYEHEHTLMLQPPFQHLVSELSEDIHEIRLVCEVTDLATVTQDVNVLERASGHFIWNRAFLSKRVSYKPNLPMYAILVRAHRLPTPVVIPHRPSYAGCKSWVHLTEEIDVSGAIPVLSDDEFASRRESLASTLSLEFTHSRETQSRNLAYS
jgi:hypothetical protein